MDPTQNTASQQPRITPRNSDADDAIATAAAKDTPWQTLNRLANIPKPTTPLQRASSAGPPSTRKSVRRTPSNPTRTPSAKIGSARRAIVVTPHGRAAQRELDLRRAGLTPGKDRRRSGRQQRETPRDALRALSRILASKTQPIVATPEGPKPSNGRLAVPGDDDLDDGEDIQRPRLSLPLGDEDDEDDSLLLPPQSAGLENENHTGHSIEFGRRAISEQPPGRLSRGSFGSVRMSDMFGDVNEIEGIDEEYSSYIARGVYGDDDVPEIADDETIQREITETLQFNLAVPQRRVSDIRPTNIPTDDTETTFVLNVPEGEASPEVEPVDNLDLIGDEGDEGIDEIIPEMEASLLDQNGDFSMQDTTLADVEASAEQKQKVTKKKAIRVSKHGIQYPSLPTGVVKKLATRFARTSGNSKAKINKDTLDAIMLASDWFFEQVSDDLGAYSKHAGRKTIDESDVVTLMARYVSLTIVFSGTALM
jgi:histone H3/H4